MNRDLLNLIINKGVFLNGNIPSLKNSKEIQTYKKWVTDDTHDNSYVLKEFKRLGPSKTVETYYKNYGHVYVQNKVEIQNLFKNDKIWKVGFYFLRDSHRKFDFINAVQIIQDLMVKYNYFEDDNMDYIWPYPLGYEVNKDNHGVIICNVNNFYPLDAIIDYFENIINSTELDLLPEIDHSLFAISKIKLLKY